MFIAKYRRRVLYGELRRHFGQVFHELARQKECGVDEGHLMADHVHMNLSIPPKDAVAQEPGLLKGKSAIDMARACTGRRRDFVGQHFWARGCLVSTVGKDKAAVRRYLQEQEQHANAPISRRCRRRRRALARSYNNPL